MRSISRFFELPAERRRLLFEAAAMLLLVRVALRIRPIDRLRAWSSRMGIGTSPAESVAWAVRAMARRIPGNSCLCSALALQRMLSARGYFSDLHIGVARRECAFAAHAWLVRGDEIVIGEQDYASYTKLAVWSAAAVSEQAAASRQPSG